MKKIEHEIKNFYGIHARVVGLLVNEFRKFKCNVTIEKGDKSANAKKIFELMSLNIKQGDIINIIFEGVEEELALKAIQHLIASKTYENIY